ncbi:tetratricopeptide repeat protein [Luminiphilus sp.]|nr:tetratricopeptide repeat protein [Luminiphilus sp.]
MITPMRNIKYSIAVLAVFLSGCTTTPVVDTPKGEMTADITNTVTPAVAVHPYADIPSDQLSVLLEAEFAIRARDLPLGLRRLIVASLLIPDPAIARRALQLAQFMRDTDATLSMAKRVSDLEPTDGEAATLAAAILIDRNDVAEALRYSQRAFASDSEINPAALLNDYAAQPDETKARIQKLLTQLAANYPDDPRSLFAMALLEWRKGNIDAAKEGLKALFTVDPYHERGTLLITEIRLQADDPSTFEALLTAIEVTNSALLRYQYARYLLGRQELENAKAQFDILVREPQPSADHLISAALVDIELSQPASALVHLDRVLSGRQRINDAYFFRGLALIQVQDTAQALDAFARVAPSTNYTRALREAANLLISDGDINATNGFFERQRVAHPQGREISFNLHADTLEALGSGEARNVLTTALSEFPQSTRLLFARATLLERLGLFNQAEADYRQILSLAPGDAGALNALGYALTNNTTRFSEAADLLEEAITKDPRNPAIIDSLGWVYFKLGKKKQAELLLKEAYKQYPDPEVAAHLIELLWSQGRTLEAKDLIGTQLRSSPENQYLLETANRLAIPLPE